jgi:beta-lactamase regulating signal transducer with metallopeptidase domain
MPPLFDLFQAAGSAHIWVELMLDSALKGAVILILALAVAVMLRHASSAVRHLAWTLAVVGLCALPALAVFAPRLRLPILPTTVVAATGASTAPEPARPNPFRAKIDPERLVLARDGLLAPTPADHAGEANKRATVSIHWTSVVLLTWAVGVVVLMARLAACLIALWHKGRRASPITDGSCAALADQIARGYGIRRRVSLRMTLQGTIPATWGLRRPVVFLPVEAIDWSHERLRAVLMHELAHVTRFDFLVQTLARVACALHWFNPLVWLAAGRLRVECERASDDLVLSAGLTPLDYATHLVELLRELRRGREAPRAALAMARRNGLEGRLRAILDNQRCRCDLSSRRVALMALAALSFLLPLGFVRLEARAHDAPKLERLPEGMTIEVVGVSTHPSGPATWWGPDGTPLANAPCDPAAEAVDSPGKQVREIVARIKGLPKGATLTWHPTQCSSHGDGAPRKDGIPAPNLQRSIAEFPEAVANCVVHFDLSYGPWNTEQTSDGKAIGIEKDGRAFFFGKAHETRAGTAIAIAHNIADRSLRVVAIDRDGKERTPRYSSSGGAGHMMMIDADFDLPPSAIREYQLQSRSVGRFEIKNVAIRPRKAGP